MNFKNNLIYYTFPNLSTIPQRGNISIRQKKAKEIEIKLKSNFKFNLVEVPADFIKNASEMSSTNLSMGEMLKENPANSNLIWFMDSVFCIHCFKENLKKAKEKKKKNFE